MHEEHRKKIDTQKVCKGGAGLPYQRMALPCRDVHRHGGVCRTRAPLQVYGLSAVRQALRPGNQMRCSRLSLAGTAAQTVGGRRPREASTQPNPPPGRLGGTITE